MRLGQYGETEGAEESRVPEAGAGVAAVWMENQKATLLLKAARAATAGEGAAKVWAPVLGWMAMRGLPSAKAALTLYDELQMRHALAEIFAGAGVTGEDAWRAAAQVRVLLRVGLAAALQEATKDAGFWEDADVRWLTGAHADEAGVEYFDRERFEALLRWVQLPWAVAGVQDDAWAKRAAELAEAKGYKVGPFVAAWLAGEAPVVEVLAVKKTRVPSAVKTVAAKVSAVKKAAMKKVAMKSVPGKKR